MSHSLESGTADDVTSSTTGDVLPARSQHGRWQFSITSLLVFTALLAVGMVLLKSFGHWGLVVITVASLLFLLYVLRNSEKVSLNIILDLIWGVGLPLLCFLYDPGIINSLTDPSTTGSALMAVALWQMSLILVWRMVGARGPAWNGAMAGGLLVGIVLAALIAIPFTPFAIVFSFMFGYGLPGLVPLLTTWVFVRNWSDAKAHAPVVETSRMVYRRAFYVSLLAALLLPPLAVEVAESLGLTLVLPRMPQTATAIQFID